MSQAFQPGNATSSALQYNVPTHWDDLLLTQAKEKYVMFGMGDKKPLPMNSGNVIKWTRYSLLGPVNAATEGTAPTPTALSSVNVTATLTQFSGSTITTDVLQMVAIDSQIESAISQLAYQAANTLDTYARNTVIGLTGGVSSTSLNVAGPGQSNNSLIRTIHSGNSNLSGLVAASNMDVNEIIGTTSYLKILNAPTFGDGFYYGVMHPKVEKDIMQDATAVTSWAAWNQGNTDIGREKMERGYIGNIAGVKFWRSTNMWYHNSGTSAAGISAYYTPIFGPGAFGVVDIDGGVKTYVTEGADSNNPAAQWATIAWKITTAARVLNPSFGIVMITS